MSFIGFWFKTEKKDAFSFLSWNISEFNSFTFCMHHSKMVSTELSLCYLRDRIAPIIFRFKSVELWHTERIWGQDQLKTTEKCLIYKSAIIEKKSDRLPMIPTPTRTAIGAFGRLCISKRDYRFE